MSCDDDVPIPTAYELFHGASTVSSILILVFGILMVAITMVIYVDVVIFVMRNFKTLTRKAKTIWIMSAYPVYSFCAFIAVMVPRASTLIALISDLFLSTCVYQFLALLLDYVGGMKQAWSRLDHTKIGLNTGPLCCCCPCLPIIDINRRNMRCLAVMVIQMAALRPILSFSAAVMWSDGVYISGNIAADNGYVYIVTASITSSVVAVWGMTLIRRAFDPLLAPHIPGKKFMPLQLLMLLTIIPNFFINILVSQDVIPCMSGVLSSKSRGDRIYYGWLIFLMIPLSLIARRFYKRQIDGSTTDPESPRYNSDLCLTKPSIATHAITQNGHLQNGGCCSYDNNGMVVSNGDAQNPVVLQESFNGKTIIWSTYI